MKTKTRAVLLLAGAWVLWQQQTALYKDEPTTWETVDGFPTYQQCTRAQESQMKGENDRIERTAGFLRAACKRFADFWRDFFIRRSDHQEQRSVRAIAALHRVHTASGILGDCGAKSGFGSRLFNAGRLLADRDQSRHTAIRPTLHSDSISDYIAAPAEVFNAP